MPASLPACPTSQIEQCLARDEATFPRSSALLAAPRCILRVLAWNLRSAPAVPLAYGTKRAFSCVRAVAEIPMPKSWTALRACSNIGSMPASVSAGRVMYSSRSSNSLRATAGTLAYDTPGSSTMPHSPPHNPLLEDHTVPIFQAASTTGSPSAAQQAPGLGNGALPSASSAPSRPPHAACTHSMSGWASRLLAGSHPRVAKTQARTLELEIEVAAMEERLRMARGLLPSAG